MQKDRLSHFRYNFQKGFATRPEIEEPITDGNCRLALQEYYAVFKNHFFSEDELLNPQGYLHTGEFIKREYGENFFDDLPNGSVVYAERIRNKNNERLDKSSAVFSSDEEYIISLHSAIFLGRLTTELLSRLPAETDPHLIGKLSIWHATAIDGYSSVWSLDKFSTYYKPVAAKRFI